MNDIGTLTPTNLSIFKFFIKKKKGGKYSLSSMELPDTEIKGLGLLKDEKYLDDKLFPPFVGLSFDIIFKKKSESVLKGMEIVTFKIKIIQIYIYINIIISILIIDSKAFENIPQSVLKHIYSSLVSLIFECAKRNTDPLEISYENKLNSFPFD